MSTADFFWRDPPHRRRTAAAPPMDCKEVLTTRKNPYYQAWCNATTMLRNRSYHTEEELSEEELLRQLHEHGDHHLGID